MSQHLARAMGDAALEIGQAATDSLVTIAHRLPILARPGAESVAEWNACVAEKAAAAWDGAVDVMTAWQTNAMEALFSPMTPTRLATQALALARVAAHPAHVAVRANATRFLG